MTDRSFQRALLTLFLVASACVFAVAPSNLSLSGITQWAIVGGHIGSGTGALPSVGAEGERYTDVSTPSAPVEYRSDGSSWQLLSGGGGGGTSNHASLINLGFSASGHTGFASAGDITALGDRIDLIPGGGGVSSHSALTQLDFSSSGHTGFASVGALVGIGSGVSTHSALANLDFGISGHTGFASESGLTSHETNQTDPHGATMTVSTAITVGAGTADAYVERSASGTIGIASWLAIIPSAASPTAPATGTLWNDTVYGLRTYDTHGTWSTILTSYPRWQDLRVPLLSTNAGGTNAPSPVVVKVNGGSQGVFAFQFSATTEQELYCSVQLPHELYKTHAHPHVHWITPTPAANATAVWGIEYCIANVNATYPAATTIATAAGGAGNVAFKHVLTELPEIDLSQAKDSSVLLVRFFRDATNASDTLGACWASDFDLHVQIRDRGSLLEYGDN